MARTSACARARPCPCVYARARPLGDFYHRRSKPRGRVKKDRPEDVGKDREQRIPQPWWWRDVAKLEVDLCLRQVLFSVPDHHVPSECHLGVVPLQALWFSSVRHLPIYSIAN